MLHLIDFITTNYLKLKAQICWKRKLNRHHSNFYRSNTILMGFWDLRMVPLTHLRSATTCGKCWLLEIGTGKDN